MNGPRPVPSGRDGRGVRDDAERPLRVMHVVGVLALAGLEYGVIKQVNRLDAGRFSPSICCLYDQVEETRAVLAARVPVFELHHQAGRNRRLVARLAGLLRRERVDVVHSHNWTSYYPTVLAAHIARVPFVVHGEHGRETAERPRRRLWIKRMLATGVTRFVTVSPELALELVEEWRVRIERVAYIPNGVDLTRFRPDAPVAGERESLDLAPHARIVTIIGGIRPVKDHATLLRAFERVLACRPEARLLVVGTDHGRGSLDELRRLATSLRIDSAVRFAGVRHDTPEILALTDVYVNSSVSEGMSNTILEAMAAGKPVVATSVGGNSELVLDGETGFLVPAGDSAALAKRIDEVLGDPELALRLGTAGRARVERRHRMERMIEEYENLYLDLRHRQRLHSDSRLREAPAKIAARVTHGAWTIAAGDRFRGPRLAILRYHRVLPLARVPAYTFRRLVTPRDVFERQMAHLKRHYLVLPLGEAVRLLRERDLPHRTVVVTFEDGYRDTYDVAWPILRRYGIPATLFVVTDVPDLRHRLWWDDVAEAVSRLRSAPGRVGGSDPTPAWVREALEATPGDSRAVTQRIVDHLERSPRSERTAVLRHLLERARVLPEDTGGLMLSWDEVREMAREGMTVGTHTRSHARLDGLTEDQARSEVSESLESLARELRTPIRWLSCPGDQSQDHLDAFLAREGIEAALTGTPGLNAPGARPYSLRTLGADVLRLEGGYAAGVFDAALVQAPGR